MVAVSSMVDRLRSSLWFVPALFAVAAFGAAAAALTIDRSVQPGGPGLFLFGGTAEGARSVLSTIAQSMLTFTALVFSITMLVLQLAASQLSPRVIRTFLRDWQNQAVLGLFVATFLFTLLILRDVRSPNEGQAAFVPGFSIWLAFAFLVASVGAFVYYINHMAHAIRATTVMDNIAAETRDAIEKLYPPDLRPDAEQNPGLTSPSSGTVITASSSGVLLGIDEEAVIRAATDWGVMVEVLVPPGNFVPEGAPLFRIRDGDTARAVDEGRLRRTATLGRERNFQQDASFGLRQLVDIALRALSPGTNDPTTAAQAIDRLHDLLRRVSSRSFPPRVRRDEAGSPRLLLARRDWEDLVRLAVVEIRLASVGHIQVVRRLKGMLDDLLAAVPAARRSVLIEQLEALDASVASSYEHALDRRLAGLPTQHGQSAAGQTGSRDG